jgi:hypothetical protein
VQTTNTLPTDLDACNGHYGPVPARTIGSDTYAAATNVYHYHATAEAPYTNGCFGPVASIAAGKALYPSCDNGDSTTYCTSHGSASIDLLCPVYGDSAHPWSPYTFTSDCYNTSITPSQSSSPSPSPSASTSRAASPTSTGAATPTVSLSVGASPSSSQPVTPSQSASPSPSSSATGAASPSSTSAVTPTASLSVGASPSNSQTATATPSRLPSSSTGGSTSPSASRSPPPGGSVAPSHNPMGGGSMLVSGETTATGQCNAATSCAIDGSSNYVLRDLDYDTNTGIFTGSIITNLWYVIMSCAIIFSFELMLRYASYAVLAKQASLVVLYYKFKTRRPASTRLSPPLPTRTHLLVPRRLAAQG